MNKNEIEFSNWLLEIGSGKVDEVKIPDDCTVIKREDLLKAVFDFQTHQDISMNAILCSTNDDCFSINDEVLHSLYGEEKKYFSCDSIFDNGVENFNISLETLNSFTPSGMPLHILKFKIGAVVMLLRNLNIHEGLCNGTRLEIIKMHKNVLEANILNGYKAGQRVLLPQKIFI